MIAPHGRRSEGHVTASPEQPSAQPVDDAADHGKRPGRFNRWQSRFEHYRTALEDRPRIGFLLRSVRRFDEIGGKHLALVIAVNLFVSIIPLLILGYAILVAFNPDRSFGAVVVGSFHLTGDTAATVERTFTNARSGRNTALSISVISLLITGFDVSATVQLAYARAFRVRPLKGFSKYLRGAAWLIVLLGVTSSVLTMRYFAFDRPWWVLVLVVPLYLLVWFTFFIVTPRLLLDLPFGWRDLARGAAVSTAAELLVNGLTAFQFHGWLRAYGQAYGAFGIALAIIAYLGIVALFWVWIAAVMGVYWERGAGASRVREVRELSARAARADAAGAGPVPHSTDVVPLPADPQPTDPPDGA